MLCLCADQSCEEDASENADESERESKSESRSERDTEIEHDIEAEDDSDERLGEDDGSHPEISSGEAEETMQKIVRDVSEALKVHKTSAHSCSFPNPSLMLSMEDSPIWLDILSILM